MHLRALELTNFRLYSNRIFSFQKGVNAIYGKNGKGKTTVLEAIYLLISGRSFRSAKLSELISHQAADFRIEAFFTKHGVEQRLALWSDGKTRRFFYNGTFLPKASSLLGILVGGLLTPDDINLIKGSPAQRRQFLDLYLAQTNPLYIHHYLRYSKALQQRNTLLRAKSLEAIELWEKQLSASGAYIINKRRESVKELQKRLEQLNKSSCWQISYRSAAPDSDDLTELSTYLLFQLNKQRSRELYMGYTTVGPQRDDLTFSLDNKELRLYASEGQQRSFIASLRLAEWYVLKDKIEEAPLMLIDDGWLGLDSSKRQEQVDHWQDMGQLLFTSTEKGPFEAANEINLED